MQENKKKKKKLDLGRCPVIYVATHHVNGCIEAPETCQVQIAEVTAFLEIHVGASELGIVGHQEHTGIIGSG